MSTHEPTTPHDHDESHDQDTSHDQHAPRRQEAAETTGLDALWGEPAPRDDDARDHDARHDEARHDDARREAPEPVGSSAPTQQVPVHPAPAPVTYRSGPAPTTTVVGLLGLLVAVAVVISRATDLDIRWDVVGPVAVVGAGVLLVVLGVAGLRGQRFRG